MTPTHFPASLAGGAEPALAFDRQRPWRLLIVPALFDEANRMRRFTVEVMRRLDAAGIDSLLPDLPGCTESTADFSAQTPETWRAAMAAAKAHFEASHVLAIRGGALVAPEALHNWHYAPANGASLLRQMLRAQTIAAREAGREETIQSLLDRGLAEGMTLAGYSFGAEFLRQLQVLESQSSEHVTLVEQELLGGSGLWLRAEPDEDAAQADALAAILSVGVKA